jgi:hypothetical protein
MLRFLQSLTCLKALSERKRQMIAVLTDPECRMSAYDASILMFNCILKTMCREDWKALAGEPTCQACSPDDELSLATTV